MSLLTETQIRNSLIATIKSAVGNLLSTMKTQSGTTPSVIRFNQKGNRPDFPFISLDHVNLGSSGRTFDRQVEEDELGNTIGVKYLYLDNSMFNIRCCGNDADLILKELKKKLEMDSFRAQFRTGTQNVATILNLGTLTSVPTQLATEYADDYLFPIQINYIDSIVDESETSIDTISIPPSNGTLVP